MVVIKNMTFGFDEKPVFRDFSLCSGGDAENPLVLLGASGCGKTTLLRIIAGLIKPEAGRVEVTDANALQEPDAGVSVRLGVSFIFQEPRLLPKLSVLQNVMLPLKNCFSQGEADERARRFLNLCGIGEYLQSLPAELSGGQRQRVSIARAWTYPAPLILMDEAFQSLDIPLRIQLMDAVRNLMQTEKRFVIAVTHDPREAIYLGKRIIVLGPVVQSDGTHGSGIVLDEKIEGFGERDFVSEKTIAVEKRLIDAICGRQA